MTWDCIDLKAAKITVRQSLNEVAGKVVMATPKKAAGRGTISRGTETVAALKRQKKRQPEERLAAGEA